MAILLFHSEKYYAGEEIIPYPLYVDNAVVVFFFISGYLFYHPEKPFSLRHKLVSVAKGMVVPYFLFTTVIAFPKALVHDDTSLSDTLSLILTGHASWFIAALITAELIFCLLLRACRGKIVPLGVICRWHFSVIFSTVQQERRGICGAGKMPASTSFSSISVMFVGRVVSFSTVSTAHHTYYFY